MENQKDCVDVFGIVRLKREIGGTGNYETVNLYAVSCRDRAIVDDVKVETFQNVTRTIPCEFWSYHLKEYGGICFVLKGGNTDLVFDIVERLKRGECLTQAQYNDIAENLHLKRIAIAYTTDLESLGWSDKQILAYQSLIAGLKKAGGNMWRRCGGVYHRILVDY